MPTNRESSLLTAGFGNWKENFNILMGLGISLLLSRFHILSSLKQFILPYRQSWLKGSNYRKPTQNFFGKEAKERRRQSSLGCGGRVENSMVKSVSKRLRCFSCF